MQSPGFGAPRLEPNASGAGRPPGPLLPWTWKDLALIVLSSFLIVLVGSFLLFLFGGIRGSDLRDLPMGTSLALLMIQSGAIAISVYVWGVWRHGYTLPDIGLGKLPWTWMSRAGLLGLLSVPLLSAIGLVAASLFGVSADQVEPSFLTPHAFSLVGLLGTLALAGVLTPVAEELFFRGVLFAWLRKRWSFWPAAFVSSLVFGVAHASLPGGVAAFAIGFLLSGVYELSASLWPSIFIHAINNSARSVLIYLLLAL